jgi:hypothetical protein
MRSRSRVARASTCQPSPREVGHDNGLDAADPRRKSCGRAHPDWHRQALQAFNPRTAVPAAAGRGLLRAQAPCARASPDGTPFSFFSPELGSPCFKGDFGPLRRYRYGRFRPSRVRIPPSPLVRPELALTGRVVRHLSRSAWVNAGHAVTGDVPSEIREAVPGSGLSPRRAVLRSALRVIGRMFPSFDDGREVRRPLGLPS